MSTDGGNYKPRNPGAIAEDERAIRRATGRPTTDTGSASPRITVRLPPPLLARLRAYSAKMGVPMVRLVLMAVEAFLEGTDADRCRRG